MSFPDIVEATLAIVLFILGMSLLITLVRGIWRRFRGRSWRQQFPRPLRYLVIRLGIAIGIGTAFFVIVSASMVLNSHRPPGDITPVINLRGASGPTKVQLDLNGCGEAVRGTITARKADAATIYSDQDGHQTIDLNRHGRGSFELSDPTAKRGLLSCYLQLPIVRGGGPATISLGLGDDMEVDSLASVPTPVGFSNGNWLWRCPAGQKCPALATTGLAVEEGARQVIVLALAALFGSIIALFIGEALIEPLRRRLDRPGRD